MVFSLYFFIFIFLKKKSNIFKVFAEAAVKSIGIAG